MRCLNCSEEFTGRYCPHCGQRSGVTRLTMRTLLDYVTELANWERGLMHTAAALLRRPGGTIEDYLAGKRADYVNPAKFLALMVSLALIAFWFASIPPEANQQHAEIAAGIARAMDRFGNALLLLTVPWFALGTRWCFRAKRLNYAEHLAMNAYVFGEQNLFSLAVLPFHHFGQTAAGIADAVYFTVIVGYFAVVLRGVVAKAWWSAITGAVLITAVVYAIFYAALAAVVWVIL
ncbi:DUF3667 domain-containing protein [Opitutus terrae]|uniref:DUF3667 domain-containing protein n=1 Tax=Opitutus terrae (strain DSM 11246 / JCM 15787 / PB90-1) TaxID=452637 RepID=B1ZSD6_OPITP|nr:DUF3667 domain-containing protein [Opitutus terrae]ACB75735.1 hypothetical protein Oter_2453 [Opitutus terrae PB90-1]